MLADPPIALTATTDLDFYRRKQNVVAIRHVSGDHLIAVIEIVSKRNKSGRRAFDDLVSKAAELLFHQIHLLVIDLQPPSPRDPNGIQGAIWDEVAGEPFSQPAEKPLTLAAYESGTSVRAFIEPSCVGEKLVDMPLFLTPAASSRCHWRKRMQPLSPPSPDAGERCSSPVVGRSYGPVEARASRVGRGSWN